VITFEHANPAFLAGLPVDAAQPKAQRDRSVVDRLQRSSFFRDYQRALETSLGLQLSLHSVDELGLAHHGARNRNPLCSLMATSNKSCSACLEFQRQLREQAEVQAVTLTCFAGLTESAVPVRVGEHVIAFLHVGQVLSRPPSTAQMKRTARQLVDWGVPSDGARVRDAYARIRVVSPRQYEGIVKMLTLFSQQLSMLSNQLVMTAERRDPPMVEKAKHFIEEHVDEALSLGEIARAVNTSTFYFCKLFRRATGLHFLDYVARVRVEKVKAELLNPHMRISEAAYAAGFQSLSQFNRVFRRVVGEQPRTWREKLAH
jgi:AraC-like DNA-binding protein